MHVQNVYLDEAGHTGGNLLDPDQPVFVYSAVAIDEKQAAAIHSEAISRFGINAEELKGSHLIRRPRGQAAISWVLERTSAQTRVVVIDKEYALAGKFFEYVFEPVLAAGSSLFYGIDFHRFIAMIVYLHFRTGDAHAKNLLENFQQMMRSTDAELLGSVLSTEGFGMEESDPLTDILTFGNCHLDRIQSEIDGLSSLGSAPGWALELSTTSVNWLLASWAEEFAGLQVYCDNSKSIAADLDFFANFVGRIDKAYLWFGSRDNPSYVYNLERPVRLVDSKRFPGVQIADVWASAVAYAFNHPNEEVSDNWLATAEGLTSNVMVPDMTLLDVTLKSPCINWAVLMELRNRSVAGNSLIQDMDAFIWAAQAEFPNFFDQL